MPPSTVSLGMAIGTDDAVEGRTSDSTEATSSNCAGISVVGLTATNVGLILIEASP